MAGSVKCGLEEYAARFEKQLEFVSTRDGLLNSLGTLLHILAEACGEEQARQLLSSILGRTSTAAMASYYVGSLARLGMTLEKDNRLKDLRPYKNDILEGLYRGLRAFYLDMLGQPSLPPVDAFVNNDDIDSIVQWMVSEALSLEGKTPYHEGLLGLLSLLILELEKASGWDWSKVRNVLEKITTHPRMARLWRRLGGNYARFYRLMHTGPYTLTSHYRYTITQPIRENLRKTKLEQPKVKAPSKSPPTEPTTPIPVSAPRAEKPRVRESRKGRMRPAWLLLLPVLLVGLFLHLSQEGGFTYENLKEGLDTLHAVVSGVLHTIVGIISGLLSSSINSYGDGEQDRQVSVFDGPLVDSVVFNVVNNARERLGLPPLSQGSVNSTLYRALDMASEGYYGHCDPQGRHPGFHYTRLGGTYALEENVGLYYVSTGVSEERIASIVEKLVEEMLYNDAESGWGHRDSLLDPTNTHADAIAVVNQTHLYLVINLEKRWVNWVDHPRYNASTGILSMKGVLLNGTRLEFAAVYYEPFNMQHQYDYSLKIVETCSSYSLGDLIAFILPPPPPNTKYVADGRIYYAVEWRHQGEYIVLAFNITRIIMDWAQPGQYTFVVYATRPQLPLHPYDKERYAELVPILEYTTAFETGPEETLSVKT